MDCSQQTKVCVPQFELFYHFESHEQFISLFALHSGGLETSIPVEQSSTIFEKNILEHLHCSNFEVRVEAFKEWLTTCNASNVVVVGHSAFFRKLLGTGQPMANCEVRKCVLSSDGVFIKQELMFAGGAKLLSP